MRLHDSITAADIPPDAVAVAGYVDGSYVWTAADWDLFPNAYKLRIAISASTNDGDVLDVETGDATPTQAPGWVAMRRAAGLARPILYCGRWQWPALRAAMAAAGQEADYWIAQYTGAPHLIEGAVAVQWAGDATSGGHYDLSDIDDTWVHGKEAPMFNPPIGPFPAVREWPDGGWLAVGVDGSMYAFGAPPMNGANGQRYFIGRSAADFVHTADGKIRKNSLGGPTIVATSGESYALAPR
jgi:hypothetical protein